MPNLKLPRIELPLCAAHCFFWGGDKKKTQAFRLSEDVDVQDNGGEGYYVGWISASEHLSDMVEVHGGR